LEDNIKMDVTEIRWNWIDLSVSEYGPKEGSCKNSDKFADYKKVEKFLNR
jgi:hypothetical protein